jgi:hypothetical protein
MGRMSTLPMMWDADLGADLGADQPSETCPYSFAEIDDYFFGCLHDFLLIREPRKFFELGGPCAQKVDADRRCWMFEAMDVEQGRQWFIIVGSGGRNWCPPYKRMKRWMYAETSDEGLLPEQFLEKADHELFVADARS